MNSEKVKEIKECLEELKDDRIGYCTNGIDRSMLTKEDVLTLINELESENERLRLENRVLLGKEIAKKEMHENLVMVNINIQEHIKQENERLKNRISELESENEKLIDKCSEQSVLWRNHFNSFYKTATEKYKDRIAELEEQRDRQAYIAEDLIQEKHRWTEQARKETAKEILQTIWQELGIDILSQCYTMPIRTFNKLKKQFGVEVEE